MRSACRSANGEGFLNVDEPPIGRGDIDNCFSNIDDLSKLSRSNAVNISQFLSSFPSYTEQRYLTAPHSLIFLDSDISPTFGPEFHTFAYKPVAKKVWTVAAAMPDEFRMIHHLLKDPLANLPVLPTNPPDFIPGIQYMQERSEKLDLDPAKWLWPEELKLVRWLVLVHETAFAWDTSERGCMDERYFPPVKIPTIAHTPWVQCNIPVPPAIYKDVVRIIKEKIDSGVYEPSTAAYRSRWFCMVKKDGKSLRLVHDLQPLNAVTIRDASVPPFVDHLAESFAGYAIYGMMDLYSGYNQRVLHEELRDLTTFQMPLGPHRLTTLPQGHANAVQTYQADTSFILQHEIPQHTILLIDDIPIKSVDSRFQREDGSYKTIPENPGIRRFIREHCIVVNRIL